MPARALSMNAGANEVGSASRLAGLGISLDDGRLRLESALSSNADVNSVKDAALAAAHSTGPVATAKKANPNKDDSHTMGSASGDGASNSVEDTPGSGAPASFTATMHAGKEGGSAAAALSTTSATDHDLVPELAAARRKEVAKEKPSAKRTRNHFSRRSVYLGPDNDESFEQKLNLVVKDRIRRASLSPTPFDASALGDGRQTGSSGSATGEGSGKGIAGFGSSGSGSRGDRIKSPSNLRSILKNADNTSGVKVQLQFRTEVPRFEIIDGQIGGSSKHVVYTVNVQAIVCVGSERYPFDWSISRRYRTFYQLHSALRSCYRKLRVSLPSKKNFSGLFGKLNHEFLENRKEGLNAYLQRITILPEIGKVDVLLAFLDVPTHIPEWVSYQRMRGLPANRGVEGEDVPHATSRADERKRRRKKKKNKNGGRHAEERMAVAREIRARPAANSIVNDSFTASSFLKPGETSAPSSATAGGAVGGPRRHSRQESTTATELGLQAFELERVEKHLFALANELFGIDEMSIVRRKLIDGAIGVLMMFMKGRSSKWINSALEQVTAADQAGFAVNAVKELLWPGGVWAEEAVPYTKEEERSDRRSARERLIEAIPAELATLLTNERCRFGAEKVFQMLQCPVLVKNLLYTHLDMLLLRLFPSLPVEGLFNARKGLYTRQ